MEQDTEELDHLCAIFEARPREELQRILNRHSNCVEEAVEAILSGETAEEENTRDQPTANGGAATDSVIRTSVNTPAVPTVAILPPSQPRSPTTTRTPTTAAERRETLFNAQKIAREKEEKELQDALRISMTPSDRGLDHISDEALAQLMNDPAFLASLDDDDLRAAAAMQAKLDVAEEEWRALEHDKNAVASSPNKLRSALSSVVLSDSLSASSSAVLQRLAERKRLKALGASFLRARSSLGIATGQEEKLAAQLEAMNRENEQEQQRRKIRLQAKAAMLEAIQQHLDSFLAEHSSDNNVAYEQWIEELHPENAHEGQLLQGLDKTIDHRFYVEESEHLQLWNAACNKNNSGNRAMVSPRKVSTKAGDNDSNNNVVDLLWSAPPPPLTSETTTSSSHEATTEEPFDPFGLFS